MRISKSLRASFQRMDKKYDSMGNKINKKEAERLNDVKQKAADQGQVVKKDADSSAFTGRKVDNTLYSPKHKTNLL